MYYLAGYLIYIGTSYLVYAFNHKDQRIPDECEDLYPVRISRINEDQKALGIHNECTTEEYRERGDDIYTFKSSIFEIIVIFRNYVGMSTFI
jgi:hypothetical protein